MDCWTGYPGLPHRQGVLYWLQAPVSCISTCRIKRPWQQIVDGYIMLGRGSSQPRDETGEARTRAVGQSEHGDGRLDRMRGDIDESVQTYAQSCRQW